MSDDEEAGKTALEAGTQAFFAAVGEGAKFGIPAVAASAGWQAMLAVTLPLMGLAVAKGAYRLFGERTALLAQGYVRAFGDDHQRVEEHAKAHEQDANYHDTMFKAFRSMADAAEPEVVEVLGYLAGTYVLAARRPDSFFRGLGRLLCELEQGELARLRLLLRSILMAWTEHHWDEEDVDAILVHNVTELPGEITFRDQLMVIIGAGRKSGEAVPTPDGAQRLFHLLKQNGFGEGTSIQPMPGTRDEHSDTPIGDRHINVAAATALRILEVVDPQPVAPPS